MATKKSKKFNLDKLVADAQATVNEFIETEFAKLKADVAKDFAEARNAQSARSTR